ncbi:MAG: DsrE family protein [Actinomycetota bacterium]|nr:DsrE family protein [Actinomycetota bacterium]
MRVTVLVSDDARWALELATAWAADGDDVRVVLLDSAAALARPGHHDTARVATAMDAGVGVSVHDDAVARRALPDGAVVDGVTVVDLDEVAGAVTEDADRAVWL